MPSSITHFNNNNKILKNLSLRSYIPLPWKHMINLTNRVQIGNVWEHRSKTNWTYIHCCSIIIHDLYCYKWEVLRIYEKQDCKNQLFSLMSWYSWNTQQAFIYGVPSSGSSIRYDKKVFPLKNKISLGRESEHMYIFIYFNFIRKHWNIQSFCEIRGERAVPWG